ncbi:TMEM175 family protein [Kaarinaea lacus]
MTKKKRTSLELSRLKMLMDVVYGIVIWRLFMLLPRPLEENVGQWETVTDMMLSEWGSFVLPLLALLIVTVYWVQNNELFGCLESTDPIHTGISIFQIFFLLLFLYAIGVGLAFEAAADSRTFESVTVFLVGAFSYWGWHYAATHDLLSKELPQDKANQIRQRNFAEPVTALTTIPFAFIGPLAWELSWFLYPLVRKYFYKKSKTVKLAN